MRGVGPEWRVVNDPSAPNRAAMPRAAQQRRHRREERARLERQRHRALLQRPRAVSI